MKHWLGIFLIALCLLGGCSTMENREKNEFYVPEERRLVIYTAHAGAVYEPLIKEFEERTGIWVEIKEGGALELLKELKKEAASPVCDLFYGASPQLLKEQNELFSYWEEISYTPLVLVYNPKLVKKSPPEGWADLLNPVWKGEIAFANPETSGSAYAALLTILSVIPGEEEEIQNALYHNISGPFLTYSREAVSEVANGNYYIGVTLEETAFRSMNEGYDISIVYPKEGEHLLVDTAAVLSNCAHEENARAFVAFLQEEDVKRYLTEQLNRHVFLEEKEDVK